MSSAQSQSIRIVLAGDPGPVRSGVASLLSAIDGVQLLAEASDGEELLTILRTVRPDIVITDLSMHCDDGYTAAERIRSELPDVRVVALSADESVEAVKKAVASGACGFLRQAAPKFELELAVRNVMHSGTYLSAGVVKLLMQPPFPDVDQFLTDRQVAVLTRIAQGKSTKEIAHELGLSAKTVDVHRGRLMKRLQIRDTASLTRFAIRKGLIKE